MNTQIHTEMPTHLTQVWWWVVCVCVCLLGVFLASELILFCCVPTLWEVRWQIVRSHNLFPVYTALDNNHNSQPTHCLLTVCTVLCDWLCACVPLPESLRLSFVTILHESTPPNLFIYSITNWEKILFFANCTVVSSSVILLKLVIVIVTLVP